MGGADAARRSGERRTGPMEGVAETLYSIRDVAKRLTPRRIREGLETVASEAENVISRYTTGWVVVCFERVCLHCSAVRSEKCS